MIIQSVIVVGALSFAYGLGLAFFAKKFQVKVDERVQKIRAVLPGANCGACGLAGCDAFAEAVVHGKVPVDGCIPGQKEVADKVAAILGKESAEKKEKQVALLHCNGTKENCKDKSDYQGIKTCSAAVLVQGTKNCTYACIGFGDCVKACPFGALSIGTDGLPKVDKEKCTACGKCVETCPKGLFSLVPAEKKVHVICSSKDIGKVTVKSCKVGCIACKACERACKFDAIHVTDNLARIDYSKCTECGACVTACPRKIIVKS